MKCTIENNDIPLIKPFKFYLDILKSLPYSKIIIIDDDGIEGEGEAVHALDANGEIQETAKFLEPIIDHLLSGFKSVSSVEEISMLMRHLRLSIIHNTGMLCGIEQALFGILSKKTGKNLTEILGGDKNDKIFIQTTIPMQDDFVSYRQSIDSILKNHHPGFVKFKIGVDTGLESQAIRYLKMKDSSICISVDANQAFASSEDKVNNVFVFLGKVKDIDISWAEQLLAKDDLDGMKYLRRYTKLKLMADESLHTPLEAEYLCQNNLVDYFNIKLAKTGGILKALEIIKIAEKYGKKVMLGGMLHGKLGIEYNLGFALSQNFVTHDFFSYFNIPETKDLNYINSDLSVTRDSLYGST